MESSKKPMSANTRPNSNEKKRMEVINPRQAKNSAPQKSKTIPTKRLEKVSSSASPSTTMTDFSFAKPIPQSEKQQLEMLTSDPMSFSLPPSSQSSERDKNLKYMQDMLESMQARNEERYEDEALERMSDVLNNSEANERFEKMQKMQKYIEELKNKKDDLGNNLIDLPEDFDEMVESAVEYKKNMGNDDVNWVEVYSSRREHEAKDEAYRKKREKIRHLDLVLKEKEKAYKDMRSSRESSRTNQSVAESSGKDSVFITKVKTKGQAKTVRPSQDFVKKNIEIVDEYKQAPSMIDRLSNKEKERLLEIEDKLDVIEEYTGILPEESVNRLEDIDKRLRNMVPQIEWEKRSIQQGQYSFADSDSLRKKDRKKQKPGDPVLREAQERRETVQKLEKINTRLLDLQNKELRPLEEDQVRSLLVENGYDFSYVPESSARTREDDLLDEAKNSLKTIQELESLNFDEVLEIAQEAEDIEKKFETLAAVHDQELENTPAYMKAKASLQETLAKCQSSQKECEVVLKKIDVLDTKLHKEQESLLEQLKYEEQLMTPIKTQDFPQPSLEDLDQEITSKVEGSFNNEMTFSDMDDINPENLPKLYHIYEKVLAMDDIPETND